MLVKSEGIVLNCILFAENDLIVKVLIKDIGLVSFLVKRGLKTKKYFQQLTIIMFHLFIKKIKTFNT